MSKKGKLVVTPNRNRLDLNVKVLKPGEVLRMKHGPEWLTLPKNYGANDNATPIPETDDGRPASTSKGWVASTRWKTANVDSIRTTFEVPPEPENSDQTIYLFCGAEVEIKNEDGSQSGPHILQPVLQFGVDDKGNRGWFVASWFAGAHSQRAARTGFTPVTPGTILTATIERKSQPDSDGFAPYQSRFEGIGLSYLDVEMPVAASVVETLEVFSDDPKKEILYPAGDTTLTEIVINGGNSQIEWDLTNRVGFPVMRVLMDSRYNGGALRLLWNEKRTEPVVGGDPELKTNPISATQSNRDSTDVQDRELVSSN